MRYALVDINDGATLDYFDDVMLIPEAPTQEDMPTDANLEAAQILRGISRDIRLNEDPPPRQTMLQWSAQLDTIASRLEASAEKPPQPS